MHPHRASSPCHTGPLPCHPGVLDNLFTRGSGLQLDTYVARTDHESIYVQSRCELFQRGPEPLKLLENFKSPVVVVLELDSKRRV